MHCKYCSKSVRDVFALDKHYQLIHWPWFMKNFLCAYCKKGYGTQSRLSTHMMTSEHTRRVNQFAGPCPPKQRAYQRRDAWLTRHHRSGDIPIEQKNRLEKLVFHTTEDFTSPTPLASPAAAGTMTACSPADSTPLYDEKSTTESNAEQPVVTIPDVPDDRQAEREPFAAALSPPTTTHWQPLRATSAMPAFTPAREDEDFPRTNTPSRPFRRPTVPATETTATTSQPSIIPKAISLLDIMDKLRQQDERMARMEHAFKSKLVEIAQAQSKHMVAKIDDSATQVKAAVLQQSNAVRKYTKVVAEALADSFQSL